MKPKEIIEKEKLGYIELTDEDIENYINYDEEYGTLFFSYDYEINKNQKETINFGFKTSCDYNVEVKKKCFGLFEDKIYIKISDFYYYNDDLKIFFKDRNFHSKYTDVNDELEIIRDLNWQHIVDRMINNRKQ